MRRRVILLLLLAIGLSPGVWWREQAQKPETSQRIKIEALHAKGARPVELGNGGRLRMVGAWALSSRNADFGSYSALLALEDGALLAFSDRGKYLRLPPPLPGNGNSEMSPVFADSGAPKNAQDIESAARDPTSRRIWLGLEGRNAILRMEGDLSGVTVAQPDAMRGWPANRGPEAMVRLKDGRFIVLAEKESGWGVSGGAGLLFAGDPVHAAAQTGFRFDAGERFSPTDMAELPDGRVLILLRKVGLGWGLDFSARLVVADPTTIREGEAWRWEEFARLDPAVPMDNYEALAIDGGEDGRPITVWLMSDDNGASYIQRTLLLRLAWESAK